MIELNKGKLVIECATDDVPIRILQGDTVVEKLSVTKEGATIRVAAGKYRVEVDGDHPEISIDNNVVTLGRGGEESVRIKLVDANENLATQKFDTPESADAALWREFVSQRHWWSTHLFGRSNRSLEGLLVLTQCLPNGATAD